jgi:hypothetical protein
MSIYRLYNNLYKERDVYIKEKKDTEIKGLKSVLNIISGELINKKSCLLNPQNRHDLIQISQIIMMNFLDTLYNENYLIYGVRTDGLIITSKKNTNIDCIKK